MIFDKLISIIIMFRVFALKMVNSKYLVNELGSRYASQEKIGDDLTITTYFSGIEI